MIVFLGAVDWANLGTEVAAAINTVEPGTARSWIQTAHRFKYATCDFVRPGTPNALRALAPKVTWAVCTDSRHDEFVKMMHRLRLHPQGMPRGPKARGCRSVRVAMMHIGSTFRGAPKPRLKADVDIGVEVRFVSADCFRFIGTTHLPGSYPIINSYGVGFTPPDEVVRPAPGKLVRVGHSPSSRSKGTDAVSKAVAALEGAHLDVIRNVSHEACLERKRACHIFVDQITKDVGGFGQSAIEALASGCASAVSMQHVHPRCWDYVPRPPLLHALSANTLLAKLGRLVKDPDELHALRVKSLAWAKANCAPEAVGRRWLDALRAAPG